MRVRPSRNTLIQKPEPWQAEAKCNDADPEMFFPDQGEWHKVKEAKAFCEDCPVKLDCLEYALTIEEPNGIWGGTNDRERRSIRRQRERRAA